jgi:YbbR domain-containing protein
MIAFLRNLVTQDLGLKLFALALAVLIWATVQFAISKGITGVTQSGTQTQRAFPELPVSVVAAASDVRAFRVHPERVDVVVRGEKGIVSQLTEREIRVTVDLTEIAAARALRQHVEVSAPPGITLVRVTPADVEVVVPPRPASGR